MPATIVVARGLVHLPPWCRRHFPAMGQRVKRNRNVNVILLHTFYLTVCLIGRHLWQIVTFLRIYHAITEMLYEYYI